MVLVAFEGGGGRCGPDLSFRRYARGGGVLPKILDRGVPRRFLNPNPI